MAKFPAPTEGIAITHFIVSRDVERSRRFYVDVLEGELSIVALANSWITISTGGEPTDDKPGVTLEPPSDPNLVTAFLTSALPTSTPSTSSGAIAARKFLSPPINRGVEIRCYMRDPDDHLIEVGQLVGRL